MNFFKSLSNLLPVANKSLLIGKWKSIFPLEKIETNSNFSNWMEQTPSSGHLKFIIEKREERLFAKVGIPIKGVDLKAHFFLYQGKLEITNKQLIIHQNESVPININYTYKNKTLTLNHFNMEIAMKKSIMKDSYSR